MPQRCTLRQARETLWNYASNAVLATATASEKLDVDNKINLVIERFITSGKWKGSFLRARLSAYNNQVTLPDSFESILKFGYVDDNGGVCGSETPWSAWYAVIGLNSDNELDPVRPTDLGDGWPTFRDPPYATFYIKAQSEMEEAPTLLLRGIDGDGQQIYTGSTEGVTLNISSTAQTTSQLFSSLSFWVKSAVTNSILRLWAVNADDATDTTLIAIIVPGKTVSNYRRYAIPICSNEPQVISALCKRAYVPARSDNDVVVPSNLGALKIGLMACQYEDKSDWKNANDAWDRAIALLDSERQEFDGDTLQTLRVMGDFGCGAVPNLYGFCY